jgi:dTDP-4-dehydrorhamnose reductase
MKVLVTGANGMLGQDLCPILEDVGAFVIETDVDTLDITNSEMVEKVLTDIHPDMVVHCAAYTNVDKAEEDLKNAELINVTGTENIAESCAKLGITLVYISTDYVFDGTKTEPYLPTDRTNPINNYGITKYEGEETVRSLCEKYYIARTSWLYGHHGKNFVETMLSLAEKPEIKVVDDQVGCPTWTVELANGILKLLSKPYGTYHVCGSGQTSWYGFAKEIFLQSGLDVNLKPCMTDEFPRPAKRPKYSVMENDGICRNWQAALKDYLELRNV